MGLLRNMTVRGGYGIFYGGRIPNGWSGVPWGNKLGFTSVNRVNQPSPNSAAFNWDNGTTASRRPPHWILPRRAASLVPSSWDPAGGRVGYTQQWNFNIQKELPGNMVLDLGYIGTRAQACKPMSFVR